MFCRQSAPGLCYLGSLEVAFLLRLRPKMAMPRLASPASDASRRLIVLCPARLKGRIFVVRRRRNDGFQHRSFNQTVIWGRLASLCTDKDDALRYFVETRQLTTVRSTGRNPTAEDATPAQFSCSAPCTHDLLMCDGIAESTCVDRPVDVCPCPSLSVVTNLK